MSFYGAPSSNTPEDHGDWISKAGWVGVGLLTLWAFRAEANDTRRN